MLYMEAQVMAVNQNLVADYICFCLLNAGEEPSVLKLHKLLYYVQAWHLALYRKVAFPGKFQAWIHGPVSRPIYDRYMGEKNMFSCITKEDISNNFETLPEGIRYHVEDVLEKYGSLSGTQLEALTHKEDPWIKARNGIGRFERSENEIDEKIMAEFYRKQLSSH